jgi:2,5-dioxopentanoate dehydrogenase
MSARPIPDVDAHCTLAAQSFEAYRSARHETRAALLDGIAEELMAAGDALIDTVVRECHLPRARIEGERGRTVGQLRMFADVVRAGAFLGLRIDPALPDRKPAPRPDLRLRMIPLGPVAVFGAANFPLAFSTAGGDTASALAAGCPVVVKAHPAHRETSAMVARAIARAVERVGLPEGVFGHVDGPGNDIGAALVQDPRIAAVAFTGSRSGGLALQKVAQARATPIPVYAEMSSINPVLLLPGALKARSAALAAEYVASMTLGAGQFCTNPGVVLAIEGDALSNFESAASEAVAKAQPSDMLHASIHTGFERGVDRRATTTAAILAMGQSAQTDGQCVASLFGVSAQDFLSDERLQEEVFGATSLIVRCRDETELVRVVEALDGQLTATLQADADDVDLARRLMPLLERRAGRLIVNGWPTGVEVAHAMVHGGPYPATTDGRSTSVGSLAIDRFLRPVSYQNFFQDLLPQELRDDRSPGAPVLVDGRRS